MKALHFGAGNIGRGFIGKLLAEAGFSVTFADVNTDILQALNLRHCYQVHVVGEGRHVDMVTGVNAVHSAGDEVIDLIASVDLITTAVGATVLARIAPVIARGLARRVQQGNTQPVNIIACENMLGATSQLREKVFQALSAPEQAWVQQNVGFVDCAVDRIVPPSPVSADDVLEVTVETFSEWIVDETQFIGVPPQIDGMKLTNNLQAFVERKLFTLNTGHAITAYLGHLHGYNTIDQAIADDKIRMLVEGAMQESGAVLIQRYGFDPVQHAAYIEKILGRFANPWLQDDVERVGRQPLRKLGREDRLIRPLLGTLEYHFPCDCLLAGIAAALRFSSDDPQAQELAQQIRQQGPGVTLAQISGLDASSEVVAQVVALYHSLAIA